MRHRLTAISRIGTCRQWRPCIGCSTVLARSLKHFVAFGPHRKPTNMLLLFVMMLPSVIKKAAWMRGDRLYDNANFGDTKDEEEMIKIKYTC